MVKRRRAITVVFLLTIGVIGMAGWYYVAATTQKKELVSFTKNQVAVKIVVEKDRAGQTWLASTFTPLQEHFHLYSKDLPKEGINGLGRPTLVEITWLGGVMPLGPLLANQPTSEYYVEILGQSFPVYPDGPVTLRLPVRLVENKTPLPTELSVTYMACSAGACLPPVIDLRIWVTLPAK